jgi:GNAT superfamily N-acetyltransferase
MTTHVVREAQLSDLDFIVRCNLAMAHETEDKGLDPETLRRGVEAALKNSEKGNYFIAEIDGRAAGTLMLTTEWSDWRNAYFWWIQSVYVQPEFRGKRLYSLMHDEVAKRATEAKDVVGIRLYVEKENAHAREVYRSKGMHLCQYDMMEQSAANAVDG